MWRQLHGRVCALQNAIILAPRRLFASKDAQNIRSDVTQRRLSRLFIVSRARTRWIFSLIKLNTYLFCATGVFTLHRCVWHWRLDLQMQLCNGPCAGTYYCCFFSVRTATRPLIANAQHLVLELDRAIMHALRLLLVSNMIYTLFCCILLLYYAKLRT